MVTRVWLVVALAFIAVPATLMGSTTYFFINENPDYTDALAEESYEPVWNAEIIEVESDSEVSTPDGYEETDTAYIHSLGLLAPSELDANPGTYKDWRSDFWHNRYWGSTITTSYSTPSLKRVQVTSCTGRYTAPGIVAVNDSTICSNLQGGGWFPGWQTAWGWRIQWAKSWTYGSGNTWSWTQIGRHSWNAPETPPRTHVGPITW